MPVFSVVVPVYGVEEYLDRCVESILSQSFNDFELVLVDDGSPDNCPAMCDRYAEKDSRVKVLHKANGGLCSARNAGLTVATGEYIVPVDSDDWIDRDALQRCGSISQMQSSLTRLKFSMIIMKKYPMPIKRAFILGRRCFPMFCPI